MKKRAFCKILLTILLTVCLLGDKTVLFISAEDTAYLAPTPDAGEEYQDSLVFFGESTTAHLKSRGVLRHGRETEQVWANESGTLLLSQKITSQTIRYPETGEHLTIGEAVARKRPTYLVLSFGLNGITGFARNTDRYLECYQALIDEVQRASPKTAIILQTVYPVTSPTDGSAWHFSQSPQEINRMIDTLNRSLPRLSEANTGVMIADSASVLRDESGALRAEYSIGDGIHLTASAYREILSYLNTHAYHLPTPLPITPDQWR